MTDTACRAQCALFDFEPRLAGRVDWLSLGCRSTPLERITLDVPAGAREILVKRDDLSSDRYGGNKVRKLEFILAQAKARGARRLITAGAAGSHHALATALYGGDLGFRVTLILFPQRLTPHVREVLLSDHALGAELRWTPRMEAVPLAVAAARVAHRGDAPYVVKPGGSDPVGTLGYVSAGLELAAQLRSQGGELPTAVYVAAGTLGTAAGLAIGLTLAGLELPIKAVRITSSLVANRAALRRLVHAVLRLLASAGVAVPDPTRPLRMIELCHDQLGEGYGRETPASRTAQEIFSTAGLELDPTYTAKAAAHLLASDPRAGTPLFLHSLSAVQPIGLAQAPDAADLPAPFARYLEGDRV